MLFYFKIFEAFLTRVEWSLNKVLICISQIANELVIFLIVIDHLTSSFKEYLFRSFARVLIGLLVLLLLLTLFIYFFIYSLH